VTEELWADPDRLRAVSPQFEKLGDDVDSALSKLQQGIQAEGRCWGKDKPGQQFEKNYPQGTDKGSVGQCLSSLAALVSVLKATGEKVTAVADGLQTQDRDNATRLKNV
jgi:hypothetical protein